MIRTLTFFTASLRSTITPLFPRRRQQLLELLEEIMGDAPPDPGCADILEAWLEEFGSCGFVLGNLALFLVGFVLMAAVDAVILHWGSLWLSTVLGALSGIYELLKFRLSRHRSLSALMLLFLLYWLISGFQWSMAFLILVLFTNIIAYSNAGGRKC